MIFSYNWLQTYFEKELPPPEKLAELLTMHIFEVEGVESVAGKTLDYAIDVKILPDRAGYAYAHANLAREINAFTNCIFKNKNFDTDTRFVDDVSDELNAEMPKVKIADEQKVPIFTTRLVSGIDNGPSPEWLQSALMAVGQRPISLIVDLTNYVMLDIGQPMHAFDADKIEGDIDIRFAREGEEIALLDGNKDGNTDGKKVKLDPTILVIADSKGALDIAGIKGGKKAEVDGNTKRILITAGNFDPSYIRKTSQKVGIKNDSTKRYENAVTLERVFLAQNEFIHLLMQEQGGASASGDGSKAGKIKISNYQTYGQDEQSAFVLRDPIRTNASFISEKIGTKISPEEIVEILRSLEIDAKQIDAKQNGDEIEVVPPLYRGDLNIAEDIIEEVARLRDINAMKGVVPVADAPVPELPSFYYSNVVRGLLLDLGFSEVYLHTLVSKGDVAVANPLTVDRSHMRNNLSDGLIKSLEQNIQNIDLLGDKNFVGDDIRIFEIGNVFRVVGKGIQMKLSLALGIASRSAKGAEEINKQKLYEACEGLHDLGIAGEALQSKFQDSVITGSTPAEGGAVPVSYSVAEFDLEDLIAQLPAPDAERGDSDGGDADRENVDNKHAEALDYLDNYIKKSTQSDQKRFVLFSPYPYIVRDIAVFIPGPTGKARELLDLILSSASSADSILKLVRQFDEFEKKNKETGEVEKTSYAFRMVFQSKDRTLTDTEAQSVMDKILEKISEKEGWEVR